MIQSRADLISYLKADKLALGRASGPRGVVSDDIWRCQRFLRYLEYVTNCRRPAVVRLVIAYLYRRQSRRLGVTIPINVFGPGLSIAHPGTIVVNDRARVGSNCRIHACVVIGSSSRSRDEAPQIGDDCYIGPGAKIFGPIRLGDDVVIGAKAVVNSSFPDGHVHIAGVPARVLPARTQESAQD